MTTHFKVSICLPTCNRPELIVQCIDSCLAQTHTEIEIVFGDHSKDERTQRLVAERYRDDPRVRCARIEPPLGQAHNVASLFERATGDKILLIHDDDYLVETGIEQLVLLWNDHPDLEVAFRPSVRIQPWLELAALLSPAPLCPLRAYARSQSAPRHARISLIPYTMRRLRQRHTRAVVAHPAPRNMASLRVGPSTTLHQLKWT